MTPKMICVTGPDGSGKTTQIARIAELLERKGVKDVIPVTIWDLLLDPTCKGKLLFNEPAQVDRYLSILHPTSRALFLYHCFHQALVLAERRKAKVLLLNAYWYKYYATEVAHGGDPKVLRELAAFFPRPDLTFYLSVDPEEAFARKAALSGYETGFASPRTQEAFVAFQRVAHGALEKLADDFGWIELDGKDSVQSLSERMAHGVAGVV